MDSAHPNPEILITENQPMSKTTTKEDTKMATNITFRASEAVSWANCPARANYIYMHPSARESVHPVGLAVGNAVHHRITGHQYDAPESVQYDRNTRTAREMDRQVESISRYATNRLKELGLSVVESEYPLKRSVRIGEVEMAIQGTIDLVCVDQNADIVIVDLKTGANQPRGAWLQLAIYAWLYGGDAQDKEAQKCGILWCPRLKSDKKVEKDYWEKSAQSLAKEAEGIIRQRARMAITTPTANPMSLSCSTCPNHECEVKL